MSKILLSIQGGRVTEYLFAKKPSELVPFKGEFPLVPEYKVREVYDLIHQHRYLDECPEWFQTVVLKAEQIYLIDTGFTKYLKSRNLLEKFRKMSASDKSTELVKYFNDNSIGLERLKID